MNRGWAVWLTFAACLLLGLAGMGALTVVALGLDRAEAESRRMAETEELARLALWRIDSEWSTLIAEESSRPYFAYKASYPAQQAYTKMFAEINKGDVLVPSPLIAGSAPHVMLYFQVEPNGLLTSPQAPGSNARDWIEPRYGNHEAIEKAHARLRQLQPFIVQLQTETLPARLCAFRSDLACPVTTLPRLSSTGAAQTGGNSASNGIVPQNNGFGLNSNPNQILVQAESPSQYLQGNSYAPMMGQPYAENDKSSKEYQGRSRAIQAKANPTAYNYLPDEDDVQISPIVPMWRDGKMMLLRQVKVKAGHYLQGCWLDWEGIRKHSLEAIGDLLPSADLIPCESLEASQSQESRRLAALPARLEIGALPPLQTSGWSPIQIALGIAWTAVALGVVGAAALLAAAMSLSERRGTFVSAVSHELRTPLTTFRLYSDMLAEGMVSEPKQRDEYYQTLKHESARLAHLVENVLAYARLERGRLRNRIAEVPLGDLAERVEERGREHASRFGMDLLIDIPAPLCKRLVRTDPSAIEQTFFNLIDNACKYASAAQDRRIHIDFEDQGRNVRILVRDHGPGIAKTAMGRLFRPFSKSAKDAADTAAGIGLGLALSRRLTQRLGGNLRLVSSAEQGACFALTMPMVPETDSTA